VIKLSNLAEQRIVENQSMASPSADLPPPKTSIGVIGWLKKNLFSSWVNAITTFVFAWILYSILKGTSTWIFAKADWLVISANFKLLFVGQYPVDQLWRVWLSFTIVSILFGISWGVWKGTIGHLSIAYSALLLIIGVLPFISGESRVWLFANIALIAAGCFVGNKLNLHFLNFKRVIVAVWLSSFPLIIFLLNGFGVLPKVATNVWGGFLLTVLISIVAIICSFPLGILLALGRISKLPIVRWFSIAYIELIRGVPLITVLFMAQIMLPLFLDGIELDNVLRVMVGVTLFSAAYMAENVRGGLQSIPRGQYEAAEALGLNTAQKMSFIIMPQALRAVIPAMVGQYISIFKDTSLVAIVGLIDLLGIAKTVVANPSFLGKQMEVFAFIALIYWIIAYAMSYASRRLEKSLGVGER
jgi:general L-amino acid transport system permease protein